jgi:hypothetical protein
MNRRAPFALAKLPDGGTVMSVNLKLWQGILGLVATLLALSTAVGKGIDTYVKYRVKEAIKAEAPAIVSSVLHDVDSLERQISALRTARATDKAEWKEELNYIRGQVDEIKAILIRDGQRPR